MVKILGSARSRFFSGIISNREKILRASFCMSLNLCIVQENTRKIPVKLNLIKIFFWSDLLQSSGGKGCLDNKSVIAPFRPVEILF